MICRSARSPSGGAVERSETERAVGADDLGGPLCDLLPRQTGRIRTASAGSPMRRVLKPPDREGSGGFAFYSIALSSTGFGMMSFVSGVSVTAARAMTIFPAGTECVSQTLPPITQSFPIRVWPPSTVAPE